MNARSWEYAITKMLSHPLPEVRNIGAEIKKVALEITPTLVKFAEPNEYYILNEQYLNQQSEEFAADLEMPEYTADNKMQVELVEYDPEGEDKILAGLMYKYQSISYRDSLTQVKKMSQQEK